MMLDEHDLQAIAGLIAGSEERMTQKIAGSEERMTRKIAESEEQMRKKIDERILETEHLLLDEIARTQNNMEVQLSKVQNHMDEMEKYYRITKLEDGVTSLLFEQVETLSERVDVLEQKMGV